MSKASHRTLLGGFSGRVGAKNKQYRKGHRVDLMNTTMEINMASSELLERLRNWYFMGHMLRNQEALEDLAELMWWVAEMTDLLGYDMEDLAHAAWRKKVIDNGT